MKSQHIYDENFYENINKIKLDEEEMVPYIMSKFNPKSVVDFGCGEGNWLAEFIKNDRNIEVLGFDGDYVSRDRLSIGIDFFKAVDLRTSIKLEKKYDLAMSLEVAEHIDEEYADQFIDNLVNASDHILFSAAIPGQGGINHVNEQWQSYWIKKFKERGYGVDYSIRKYFWNNNKINSWRRQNILFFGKDIDINRYFEGEEDVVHPLMLEHCLTIFENNLSETIEYMIKFPNVYEALKNAIEKRLCDELLLIYPYGRNGRLCEMLLKYYFKTNNYYLIDNKIGGDGYKKRRFEDLSEAERGKCVLLNVCGNSNIYDELVEIARRYIPEDRMISVFPGGTYEQC